MKRLNGTSFKRRLDKIISIYKYLMRETSHMTGSLTGDWTVWSAMDKLISNRQFDQLMNRCSENSRLLPLNQSPSCLLVISDASCWTKRYTFIQNKPLLFFCKERPTRHWFQSGSVVCKQSEAVTRSQEEDVRYLSSQCASPVARNVSTASTSTSKASF